MRGNTWTEQTIQVLERDFQGQPMTQISKELLLKYHSVATILSRYRTRYFLCKQENPSDIVRQIKFLASQATHDLEDIAEKFKTKLSVIIAILDHQDEIKESIRYAQEHRVNKNLNVVKTIVQWRCPNCNKVSLQEIGIQFQCLHCKGRK